MMNIGGLCLPEAGFKAERILYLSSWSFPQVNFSCMVMIETHKKQVLGVPRRFKTGYV